jgi:L-lactate dehydrogenase complex protein LldG
MTTRTEFLRRVRAEVRRAPVLFPAAPAPRPERPAEAAAALRRELAPRWPEALRRFQEEFEQVNGVFHRLLKVEDVPDLIRDIARESDTRELLAWHPAELGLDLRPSLPALALTVVVAPEDAGEEARARYREAAARARIGVTGVEFAVAETGTLILLSGAGRPGSTSLLPETHVAIFGKGRLVETLPQVGVMLEALHADAARALSGAVISFITGPSRTADIELTLTRGVHGPRDVHAIFVDAL